MRIKSIISQSRRDLTANYVCEHCGTEDVFGSYDDSNFHQNVIPNMKCKECGQSAKPDYRPLTTKYADYEVV